MKLVKRNFQFLAQEGAKIAPECTYPFYDNIYYMFGGKIPWFIKQIKIGNFVFT